MDTVYVGKKKIGTYVAVASAELYSNKKVKLAARGTKNVGKIFDIIEVLKRAFPQLRFDISTKTAVMNNKKITEVEVDITI